MYVIKTENIDNLKDKIELYEFRNKLYVMF